MAEPETTDKTPVAESETSSGHTPYVADGAVMPEFTWSAVLVGAALGILFGASSLYLVLRVGMTVSASIPVAVISITLFRAFSHTFGVRRATILENNIVQTTGSAGESIAFGVGVTMPAVMILGFEMEITRVMVVSLLGGMLGILMMIPLRRAFIVKQHGVLRYPEGTACADVLVIGETGGSSAKTVFAGFGLAFAYTFLNSGMRLWKEIPSRTLGWLKGATPALESNPALLGVGYIIGTRIASVMVAGGLLASFVLVPAIRFFGENVEKPLYPGTIAIAAMDADQIRKAYVLYIGAGAVAAGGMISLCRALPLIVASILAGIRDLRGAGRAAGLAANRTDRDMPISVVLFGSLALVTALWVFLGLDPQAGGGFSIGAIFNGVNLVASVLIVLFGFLFVTVSSRLTGEIGSSSNPISGMTIATLLLTCLIFLVLGWTDAPHRLIALSIAAVVCIASSNGGTTSQDLKTGFLVGATPKYQQWAILVGTLSSALVIGVTLLLLNSAGTVYSRKNLPQLNQPLNMDVLARTAAQEKAPGDENLYYVWHPVEGNPEKAPPGKYLVDDRGQIHYLVDPGINGKLTQRDDGTPVRKFTPPQAELFALITQGILSQKLPWVLVLLGVSIAVVMELCHVSSLPFAVGVYLPLSSSTPIFVGGLVRYFVERSSRKSRETPASELESEMSPGVLLSTGYIAGGTIAGVIVSFLLLSDPVSKSLGRWQYGLVPISAAATLDRQIEDLARSELGDKASAADTKRLAGEIREINSDLFADHVELPPGTTLALPGGQTGTTSSATSLKQYAADVLGSPDKAAELLELNADRLRVTPETRVRMPQHNLPAMVAFSLLALFLAAVGVGWFLKE
ncbi:MAG: OPT family oligopeptide transporter [Thermoguttaceae bacterium]